MTSFPFSFRFAFCALVLSGNIAQAQVAPKRSPTQSAPAPTTEKAVLRVGCEGDSAGAEVSINGEIKGQCPLDMEIPVGVVRIRAAKPAGPNRERVFEKELRLGTGVVQRVEVVVGWYQTTAEAIKRWERAANAGDAQAMYELGWAYEWGTAGVIDFVKSSAYYGQAAAAGHPAGMYEYARAIYQGRAVEKSKDIADSWSEKAFAKNYSAALYLKGVQYQYSKDPQQVSQSRELFVKAAQAGSAIAMIELQDSESDPAKKQNFEKQIVQIELEGAESGRWRSMRYVLTRYIFGMGLPKDPAKAEAIEHRLFTYAEKLAATGDAGGLKMLADYNRSGSKWNAKDKAMAEKLYREAIAKGDSNAQRSLDLLLKE